MKKIDLKDKKLLLELFKNGRESSTNIAKQLNIPKEVVSYRIKKLEKEEILLNIIPIIDFSRIGYTIYRLQLKFNSISNEKKYEFIKYAKKLSYISWIVNLEGKWDLVLLFFIRNNYEFKEVYNDILKKYNIIINDKLFTIVTEIYYFSPNYLLDEKKTQYFTGNSKESFELDEIKINLIKILFKNGRENLLNISKQLNVTLNTAKYHLNILIEKKIIVGFRPIININKLGFEHFKIVMILENSYNKEKLIKL